MKIRLQWNVILQIAFLDFFQKVFKNEMSCYTFFLQIAFLEFFQKVFK